MKKIKLWKNQNELSDQVAIVDDEDFELVQNALARYNKDGTLRKNSGKWYVWTQPYCNGKYYAISGARQLSIHRTIMSPPKGMDVDHINGDPLDNRRSNLRICTRSQNSQNKKLRNDSASGYKGVYEIKNPQRTQYISKKTGEVTYHYSMPTKRFRAYIGDPETPATRKRNIKLGYHATAEEAARAYDKKAIELFGEFALLNFPEEQQCLKKY